MWKRSVGLSRYAVGGAMEIGESGSVSGWLKDGEILRSGTGERRLETGFEHGGRASMDPRGVWAQTDALTPRGRGDGSSCDMRPPVREGRGTAEHLDAPEGPPATAGAQAQALRQKMEEELYCLVVA